MPVNVNISFSLGIDTWRNITDLIVADETGVTQTII